MATINPTQVVTNDYARAESPAELITKTTLCTVIVIYDPVTRVGYVGDFAEPRHSKMDTIIAEHSAKSRDPKGFISGNKTFLEMMGEVITEFPDYSRLEVTVAGTQIELPPSVSDRSGYVSMQGFLEFKDHLREAREQRIRYLLDYFSSNGFDMYKVHNKIEENNGHIELRLATETGEVTITPHS